MPDRQEIQEQQGWTDDTMLDLAEEFIQTQKLWPSYEKYLNERARDENDECERSAQ
jgi:hypothetical protein